MLLPTKSVIVVRVLYGLFFASTGCMIAVGATMGWPSPRQPTLAAQSFTDALDAARIINPLLSMTYIAGGLSLLFDRTGPLGIVLLAPAIGTIFFFHLVLSGQVVWGSANALCLATLAWHYRERLSGLWTEAPSAQVRARKAT